MATPLTGFEESGGVNWTTLAQEVAFLGELATNPKVSVTQIGPSTDGNPIALVRVGGPGSNLPSVLVIGCQHGNEPAGREASFQWARELAQSTDPAVVSYLNTHTIWLIPTPNPDGRNRYERHLTGNVDLNRDHVSMVSPEGRALGSVMGVIQPHVILDLHEAALAQTPDMQTSTSTSPLVDAGIVALGQELNDHVKATLDGHGYTTGEYVEGNDSPRTLRNLAGLRYALGIVAEGIHYPDRNERVLVLVRYIEAARQFHAANTARIADEVADAKARTVMAGATPGTFILSGRSVIPSDYYLTVEQRQDFLHYRQAFNVQTDGGWVRLSQPSYPILPYLLDESSVILRVIDGPPGVPPPPPKRLGVELMGASVRVRSGGGVATVERIDLMVGGSLQRIWSST